MAILSDPLCRAGPKIAQIGRERAETGPAGFGRGEGLKSPPRAARLARAGISGYECASLDTLGRVGCYRARGEDGQSSELTPASTPAQVHPTITTNEPALHPYSAYGAAYAEWFGDVPTHWKVRRLRTIAEIRVSNVDKHTREDEIPVRLCNYVDVYKNDRITPGYSLHDGNGLAGRDRKIQTTTW